MQIKKEMFARRFPPPWSVEEQPACFVVRDHNDLVCGVDGIGFLKGIGQ